jgi:hypothetical protein
MAKLHRTTIHASSREEEDVGMNPMIQRKRQHNHQHNHQSQSHTPPEVNGATDALASALHMPSTFLFFLIL